MKADLSQLSYYHPTLVEVLNDLEDHYGFIFTITSQYRKGEGVHSVIPLRGTDLSCPDVIVGKVIEAYINAKWSYDHIRTYLNVCLFHDSGSGLHLHIQVHDNTELR